MSKINQELISQVVVSYIEDSIAIESQVSIEDQNPIINIKQESGDKNEDIDLESFSKEGPKLVMKYEPESLVENDPENVEEDVTSPCITDEINPQNDPASLTPR